MALSFQRTSISRARRLFIFTRLGRGQCPLLDNSRQKHPTGWVQTSARANCFGHAGRCDQCPVTYIKADTPKNVINRATAMMMSIFRSLIKTNLVFRKLTRGVDLCDLMFGLVGGCHFHRDRDEIQSAHCRPGCLERSLPGAFCSVSNRFAGRA